MTSATQLTSRERVCRAMIGQDHDRVPRYDTYWRDTIERWQREGLDGDEATVLEMLGSDFQLLYWQWPFAYPEEVILEQTAETQVTRDRFGRIARWWKGRSGTPEHIGFDCETREHWETRLKPMFQARAAEPLDMEPVKTKFKKAVADQRWSFLVGVEPFEMSRAVMGDETTMIAMMEDPQWIRDFSRVTTDITLARYQQILDTGIQPDGLWTYGDMAYKNGTMCSPKHYRELIWPDHKRLCDFAHANDMKFIFHTDGDVNGVMDMYVEAGFDCLQPLEAKAYMDIRKLCPIYGDKLTFFGNIDVMLMGQNDLPALEQEIKSKFETGMATKRYMYHSDHSVPPSCSFATYQAIIEMIDRYGTYDT